MNKDIIKDVLRFKSEEFTFDEISSMLNDELEKEPENMDTELVELCTDALAKYSTCEKSFVATEKTNTEKVKRFSVRKTLIVAAAAGIAVAAMAIPTGAYFFNVVENESMIRVFDDEIVLDFSNGTRFYIDKEFEYYKLGAPMLPAAFAPINVTYNSSEKISDNEARFSFTFNDTGLSGSLTVTKTNDDTKSVVAQKGIREKALKYETVETRFESVVVYSLPENDKVYCLYCYNGMCYCFTFETDDFDNIIDILD